MLFSGSSPLLDELKELDINSLSPSGAKQAVCIAKEVYEVSILGSTNNSH